MSPIAIDWDAARARLRKSEDALRETLSQNPARMTTVFRQRAIQLARVPDTNEADSVPVPALVFRLAGERHAIALSELAEVVPYRDCTPVPGASSRLLGVINLRGELRPVLDLARILTGSASLLENGPAPSGVILILRRGFALKAALKVDGVEELREILVEKASQPAAGKYYQSTASGTFTLLNVESLLSAIVSGTQGEQ